MTPRVAGIGEILWDCFPDGDRLGGAPANFAFHAEQLGAQATIVSRVGIDADGERLTALLNTHGLSTKLLQCDDNYPTGRVRVELHAGEPSYVIESPAAWDRLDLTDELKHLATSVDAVCFGTLAQRHAFSQRTIQQFIRLTPPKTLRLFDINLRQDFFTTEIIDFGLSHATALKLNSEEVKSLAQLFSWPADARATIAEIFKRYPLELITLTKGAEGCEIHTRDRVVQARAPQVTCVDAVGAGDAFSAALVNGLLANQSLQAIADQANRIGAYVASQAGAMPPLPTEYKRP
jgi:fructokinase